MDSLTRFNRYATGFVVGGIVGVALSRFVASWWGRRGVSVSDGEEDQTIRSINLPHRNIKVTLICRKYILQLRTPFGTSHSRTTARSNGLFILRIESGKNATVGYGEVGLPPKKPGCYYSDYTHVRTYALLYTRVLESLARDRPDLQLQPLLLKALDVVHSVWKNKHNGDDNEMRAPRNGVEMAILDIDAKSRGLPLYQSLRHLRPDLGWRGSTPVGLGAPRTGTSEVVRVGEEWCSPPTYYTASLSPSIEDTVTAARFGLHYTPNIKIKLNHDLQHASEVLAALYELAEEMVGATDANYHWSIDANAAWTPQIAREFLAVVQPYIHRVSMVEQPFPVDVWSMSSSELAEWAEIKALYQEEGLRIYADESVRTAADVPCLVSIAHGINVKLDKTGGFLGALEAIHQAREHGMLVWVGMMVASTLSATASAHLLAYADLNAGCDLDGSILCTEESQLFTDGFQWGTGEDFGRVVLSSHTPGIGVTSLIF